MLVDLKRNGEYLGVDIRQPTVCLYLPCPSLCDTAQDVADVLFRKGTVAAWWMGTPAHDHRVAERTASPHCSHDQEPSVCGAPHPCTVAAYLVQCGTHVHVARGVSRA